MSVYTFAPEVLRDLADIWQHIAEDNPDAADRVLDSIQAAFDNLADLPGMACLQLPYYLPLPGRASGNFARSQWIPGHSSAVNTVAGRRSE